MEATRRFLVEHSQAYHLINLALVVAYPALRFIPPLAASVFPRRLPSLDPVGRSVSRALMRCAN